MAVGAEFLRTHGHHYANVSRPVLPYIALPFFDAFSRPGSKLHLHPLNLKYHVFGSSAHNLTTGNVNWPLAIGLLYSVAGPRNHGSPK